MRIDFFFFGGRMEGSMVRFGIYLVCNGSKTFGEGVQQRVGLWVCKSKELEEAVG